MALPLRSASIEPAPVGHRFVVTERPSAGPVRGTVLFAAPFAEEMNKSRRMVALAARALAADGWRVVRADLLGCGDSSGDFGDASWSDWIDDLRRQLQAAVSAGGPVWLWALRAGALLLPPLLEDAPSANLLLWQPATSGALVLKQFLRLKTVGALAGGGAAANRQELLERLLGGEPLEVAGYLLSPGLAAGLNVSRLELPQAYRGRVVWLEVASDEQPQLSPAGARVVEAWRSRGCQVEAECLAGASFWQTAEIAEVPQLVEVSRALLSRSSAPSTPAVVA